MGNFRQYFVYILLVLIIQTKRVDGKWFGFLSNEKVRPQVLNDPEATTDVIHQWVPSTKERMTGIVSTTAHSKINAEEAVHYIQEVTVGLKVSEMCLRKATFTLSGRCMDLSEQDLGKFAVLLTNCHLAQSNRATYQCRPDDTLEYCTNSMSDVAFGVYTTILTHTQDICIRLQEEVRWEASETVMLELLDKSYQTAVHLGSLSSATTNLVRDMNEVGNLNRKVFDEVKTGFAHSLNTLQQIESSTGVLHQTLTETAKKQQEIAEAGLNSLDLVLTATGNIQETSLKSLNDLESLSEVAHKQQELSEAGLESLKKVLSTTDNIKETSESIREASKKSLDGLEQLTASHNRISRSISELSTQTDLATARQKELLDQQLVLAEEQLRLQELGGEISNLMGNVIAFRNLLMSTFRGALWYMLYLSCVYMVTTLRRLSILRFPLIFGILFAFGVEMFYITPSLSEGYLNILLGVYRIIIGCLCGGILVYFSKKWEDRYTETRRMIQTVSDQLSQLLQQSEPYQKLNAITTAVQLPNSIRTKTL